jgi:hypothetical protein
MPTYEAPDMNIECPTSTINGWTDLAPYTTNNDVAWTQKITTRPTHGPYNYYIANPTGAGIYNYGGLMLY